MKILPLLVFCSSFQGRPQSGTFSLACFCETLGRLLPDQPDGEVGKVERVFFK